ncbi:efflux RND transporter periplasmic adaptor subunit [Coprobacter fastidiosus]|uniref:RND family efflux transporter MFP subunit n=1 Tax=Coprobacter fastidiosus NSB1 = JCM 33896 TaxID=1349822 RepID=A0A495WNC6_9BACT|nr:efflux RND transporter periplasmic adaptor subunit [Coprobacter fastidiosus]RKT61318.1 RND family efflux transporter MFP subunit [Coprobacter fastidiosus NSB1 = JCM 33896]BEG61386.1 efflux RND transporter periplasmic adaptor subunit [Coprobacter fastidiosus]
MVRNKKFCIMSLAASVVMFSCTSEKKQEVKVDEKPLVRLETVKTQEVEQIQEFTATVEANVVNNIVPSMSLRINDILVEVGDHVRKGQVLAQMDKTNLLQSQTQLENIQLEYDRAFELYKVGGASKQSLDAQKTQLDVAKTAYENLKENTRLVSPINGIVTARNYDSGDMIGGEPVVTIEQMSPVKLLVNVSENFYTRVRKGMDVNVKVEVYGDEIFHGKVSLIYPTVDPQTRTFPVEIKLPNKDLKVRPGMFARVTMNFGTQNHVVAPDLSIIKQAGSGDRYIYVYKDGKVSYNKVLLGRRMDDKYEIISGVSDGDQVVVAGQSRLTNGAEVSVENAE